MPGLDILVCLINSSKVTLHVDIPACGCCLTVTDFKLLCVLGEVEEFPLVFTEFGLPLGFTPEIKRNCWPFQSTFQPTRTMMTLQNKHK